MVWILFYLLLPTVSCMTDWNSTHHYKNITVDLPFHITVYFKYALKVILIIISNNTGNTSESDISIQLVYSSN